MRRLDDVTLVCIDTTARQPWSVAAVRRCIASLQFAEVLFFAPGPEVLGELVDAGVRWVPLKSLESIGEYSNFVVRSLPDHVRTSHALIVQWDGFVIAPEQWSDEFLTFDYIGAPWTHAPVGQDVGNGGFSLRSSRLMVMARELSLLGGGDLHPEDVFIGVTCRPRLEGAGMRFPSAEFARRFSVELGGEGNGPPFGFHGPYHFPAVFDPASGELSDFVRTLDGRSLDAWWMGEFLRRIRLYRFGVAEGAVDWSVWKTWLATHLDLASEGWCSGEDGTSLLKSLIRYGYLEHAGQLLARRRACSRGSLTDVKLRLRMWVQQIRRYLSGHAGGR